MTSYGAFTLLWQKILRSSIWVKESKETRLVWVALLALRGADGRVFSSKVGLADAAKVSEDECAEALRILMAPDPDDTSGVKEGRRIEAIPGGWQIVNHDMYQFSTEAKRLMWAQQKSEQRAKAKQSSSKGGKAKVSVGAGIGEGVFSSRKSDPQTAKMIAEDLREYQDTEPPA